MFSQMYIYRYSCKVQYRYYCQILMKLGFSRQFSQKYSNVICYENSHGGRRVVTCGLTDRQTDRKKLINAFRNFANAPKDSSL